jgi:hypothetical protein
MFFECTQGKVSPDNNGICSVHKNKKAKLSSMKTQKDIINAIIRQQLIIFERRNGGIVSVSLEKQEKRDTNESRTTKKM